MRYANAPVPGRLAAVDRTAVGVLAFTGSAQRPVACAVTPFVDGDDAVVTSVLALLRKVGSIRRNPSVALLAGEVQLRGNARVQLDEAGVVFRARLQAQELRKYPPSRMLLRLPFHRRLFWWYAGRAIIRVNSGITVTPGSDRVTVTYFSGDGLPLIVPLQRVPPLDGPTVDLRGVSADGSFPDGPACLLVHEEYRRCADLRQLRLSGDISDNQFVVSRRVGSLRPAQASLRKRLSELRAMAAMATANRALIAAWRDGRSEDAAPPATGDVRTTGT
jgi:hypothetical protein